MIVVLAACLSLLATSWITAQQPRRQTTRKVEPPARPTPVMAPVSLTPTAPAKEYIYAGGKLVATEEPTLFSDVPVTHPFYADILKLAAKEVTLGYGDGTYRPDDLVSRAQMALFIERALGFHTPPPGPATPTFADVPNSGATDSVYEFIEHFYAQGITSGCQAGPPKYFCPWDSIIHSQMAVFISRAVEIYNGRSAILFDPPMPAQQAFCDVPPSYSNGSGNNYLFYRFIDHYANVLLAWPGCGVIPGNNRPGICAASCTPPPQGSFCPDCQVTRGEMAYILVHAFKL